MSALLDHLAKNPPQTLAQLAAALGTGFGDELGALTAAKRVVSYSDGAGPLLYTLSVDEAKARMLALAAQELGKVAALLEAVRAYEVGT